MAFVPVPRDLSKVKTKIMFNLTGRQLVCFGLAIIIAIPAFIFLQSKTGNEVALLIVAILISPLIFFGVFEKDGLTGEKYLKKMFEVRFKKTKQRVYRNNNHYETLNNISIQYQNYKPAKRKRGVKI